MVLNIFSASKTKCGLTSADEPDIPVDTVFAAKVYWQRDRSKPIVKMQKPNRQTEVGVAEDVLVVSGKAGSKQRRRR